MFICTSKCFLGHRYMHMAHLSHLRPESCCGLVSSGECPRLWSLDPCGYLTTSQQVGSPPPPFFIPLCLCPCISLSAHLKKKKISLQSQFLPQKDTGADGMQSSFMAGMTVKTITSQHALPRDATLVKGALINITHFKAHVYWWSLSNLKADVKYGNRNKPVG